MGFESCGNNDEVVKEKVVDRTLHNPQLYKKQVWQLFKELPISEEMLHPNSLCTPEIVSSFGELIKEKVSKLYKDKEEEFYSIVDNVCQGEYVKNKDFVSAMAAALHDLSMTIPLTELEANAFEAAKGIHKESVYINRLINYDNQDHEIHLHVNYASSLSTSEKLRLLKEAFHLLATRLKEDKELTDIEVVSGTSWIFKSNPGLAEKLGFTIDEEASVKGSVTRAFISKEDFVKRYS